ncbi:MAG TPA: type III secretion protein, partial [Ruminococcaceae bacterium]|nr:type III secretion protein [Oscillospiraceae bacterium]
YDPQSNVSMPISGSIFNLLFILMFFCSNSHLTFIKIMTLSFEMLPVGAELFNADFSKYIVDLFGSILVLAVKLALPVIAIEMITEIGLGVLMRTVPQINIFVVGLQLKLTIGLIIIVLILPGAANLLDHMTTAMFQNINKLLHLMQQT